MMQSFLTAPLPGGSGTDAALPAGSWSHKTGAGSGGRFCPLKGSRGSGRARTDCPASVASTSPPGVGVSGFSLAKGSSWLMGAGGTLAKGSEALGGWDTGTRRTSAKSRAPTVAALATPNPRRHRRSGSWVSATTRAMRCTSLSTLFNVSSSDSADCLSWARAQSVCSTSRAE
jgi:hypothetical protein